jgi:hypothetical protein
MKKPAVEVAYTISKNHCLPMTRKTNGYPQISVNPPRRRSFSINVMGTERYFHSFGEP